MGNLNLGEAMDCLDPEQEDFTTWRGLTRQMSKMKDFGSGE
jgi:hypothetical protein